MTVYFGPIPEIDNNSNLLLKLDATRKISYPGTGTTWYDMSGNGNNGTFVNNPVFDNKNQGSILFNGINSYIQFSSIAIGAINSSIFSFGAWFYFDGTNQSGTIISKSKTGQYTMRIGYSHESNSPGRVLIVYLRSDQLGSGTDFQFDYSLTYTGWYNVVVVVNVNQQFVYINGVKTLTTWAGQTFDASKNYSGNTFNIVDGPLYIGAQMDYYTSVPINFFQSKISQAFIYNNRALTPFEILQNYNARRGLYYS